MSAATHMATATFPVKLVETRVVGVDKLSLTYLLSRWDGSILLILQLGFSWFENILLWFVLGTSEHLVLFVLIILFNLCPNYMILSTFEFEKDLNWNYTWWVLFLATTFFYFTSSCSSPFFVPNPPTPNTHTHTHIYTVG